MRELSPGEYVALYERELWPAERRLRRTETALVLVLVALLAFNLYIGALSGFLGYGIVSLGAAVYSALVLRAIIVRGIERRRAFLPLRAAAWCARQQLKR